MGLLFWGGWVQVRDGRACVRGGWVQVRDGRACVRGGWVQVRGPVGSRPGRAGPSLGPAGPHQPAGTLIGAADPTSQAPEGDAFATFRDPFTYFDGVLHSPACAHDDVGLEGLASDLRSARSTPALSYIVPDLCHDGRPTPCAPGAPSGLPAAEAFLRRVVPEILASPAYRHGGLLIVTTDQAPTTGEYADSSSCC